jgi:hypothetical protein
VFLIVLFVVLATSAVPQTRYEPVDLELVLAVDVSQSVDAAEARLQRDGYLRALRDPRFAETVRRGHRGRIAVTYVEWADAARVRIPWRVIASAADAEAFADELEDTLISRNAWTSIHNAILLGIELIARNDFAGDRRVIDLSGDGPNNIWGNVTLARDAAVAAGITVNGLPILVERPDQLGLRDLDVYYRECVIGGPNAFVIAATFESFAEAILRKLILEVAETPTLSSVVRVQGAPFPAAPLAPKYAPACDIGERLRQQYVPGVLLP